MENLVSALAGRRVLVTGHTGFKGSWLCAELVRQGAQVRGLALPPDNSRWSAYHRLGIGGLLATPERDCFGDVTDANAFRSAVVEFQPEIVFHLAAQALVSRGWTDPDTTYRTNIFGTFTLLDELARYATALAGVVVITSDKVYANDSSGRAFVEADPLGGTDPYSNSKSCAELVVVGNRPRFRVPVTVARAGNVIGGGDVCADRLVPDIIRAWRKSSAKITGTGAASWSVDLRRPDATRPWQHVIEPILGYIAIAEAQLANAPLPPAINFGPLPAEVHRVCDVVDAASTALGNGGWNKVGESFEEATTLGIDPSLAELALGWVPTLTFDEAVRLTCEWEQGSANNNDMLALTYCQIDAVRSQTERNRK